MGQIKEAKLNLKDLVNTGSIVDARVNNGGKNYIIGDVLKVSGGADGKVTVNNVTNGAITGITILNAGSGYADSIGITTTGGSQGGLGALLNIKTDAESKSNKKPAVFTPGETVLAKGGGKATVDRWDSATSSITIKNLSESDSSRINEKFSGIIKGELSGTSATITNVTFTDANMNASDSSQWMGGMTLSDISGLQDVMNTINDTISVVIDTVKPLLDFLKLIISTIELIISILQLLGSMVADVMSLLKQALQALKDEFIKFLNDMLGQGMYLLPAFLYFPWKMLMRQEFLNPISSGNTFGAIAGISQNANKKEMRRVADPWATGTSSLVRVENPYSVKYDFNKFVKDIVDSINDTNDRMAPVFSDSVNLSGLVVCISSKNIMFLVRLILVCIIMFMEKDTADDFVKKIYEALGELPPDKLPSAKEDLAPPLRAAERTIDEWYSELLGWLGKNNPTQVTKKGDTTINLSPVVPSDIPYPEGISAWSLNNIKSGSVNFGSYRHNYINISVSAVGEGTTVLVNKYYKGQSQYKYDTNDLGAYCIEMGNADTFTYGLNASGEYSVSHAIATEEIVVMNNDGTVGTQKVYTDPGTTDITTVVETLYATNSITLVEGSGRDTWQDTGERTSDMSNVAVFYNYDTHIAEAYYFDPNQQGDKTIADYWTKIGDLNVFTFTPYDTLGKQIYGKEQVFLAFRYSLKNDNRTEDKTYAYIWNDNYLIYPTLKLDVINTVSGTLVFSSNMQNIGNAGTALLDGTNIDTNISKLLPITLSSATSSKDITTTMMFMNDSANTGDILKASFTGDITIGAQNRDYENTKVRLMINGKEVPSVKSPPRNSTYHYNSLTLHTTRNLNGETASLRAAGTNLVEIISEYTSVVVPYVKPPMLIKPDKTKVPAPMYSNEWFMLDQNTRRISDAPIQVVTTKTFSTPHSVKLATGTTNTKPVITSATKVNPTQKFEFGFMFMEGQSQPTYQAGIQAALISPGSTEGIKSGIQTYFGSFSNNQPAANYILRGIKSPGTNIVFLLEPGNQSKLVYGTSLYGTSFIASEDVLNKSEFSFDSLPIPLKPGTTNKFTVWSTTKTSISSKEYESILKGNKPVGGEWSSPVEHVVTVTGDANSYVPKAPNWISISMKSFFDVVTPVDQFLQNMINQITVPPNLLQPAIDWLEWMKEKVEWLTAKLSEVIKMLDGLQNILNLGGEGFWYLGINNAPGSNGFIDRIKNASGSGNGIEDLINARYVTGFVILMPSDPAGTALMSTVFNGIPSSPPPGEDKATKRKWISVVDVKQQTTNLNNEYSKKNEEMQDKYNNLVDNLRKSNSKESIQKTKDIQ